MVNVTDIYKKLTETYTVIIISLYPGIGMTSATFFAAYLFLTMPNLKQFIIISLIYISGTIVHTLS